ncbi:MAG: hypothetical protein K2K92_09560 [Duncaniella sp.]|nr:hypothetical protein [Duncaniella sp.]
MRYVKIGLAVLVMLMLTGRTMMLYYNAVIAWWIVPAVATALALALSLHTWRGFRWLTGLRSMLPNYLCSVAVLSIFTSFLFFEVNSLLSRSDTERTEPGIVTAHVREERHRTRRVGRRYVTNGEKYYEYNLLITLDDGSSKLIRVSNSRYRNIKNGDSLTVPVREGGLGVAIMRIDSLRFITHPKKKPQSKLRYFGGRKRNEAR